MTLRLTVENLKDNPSRKIRVRRASSLEDPGVLLAPGEKAEFVVWQDGGELVVSEPQDEPAAT